VEERGGLGMEVIYAMTCDIGKIGSWEPCVEEEERSMSNMNYKCLGLVWVLKHFRDGNLLVRCVFVFVEDWMTYMT